MRWPALCLLWALQGVVPAALAQSDEELDWLFGGDSAEQTEVPDAEEPSGGEAPRSGAAPQGRQEYGDGRGGAADSGGEVRTIAVDRQSEPAVEPPPRGREIEEIIVTAQKTEQSLRDVPISITALDGSALRDRNVLDLNEAATFVPNVRVEARSPTAPQVFIRGFGTNTFNPAFEPAVGLVVDELFLGRAGYFTESMFDLARIEVLRGPQGTLFGKNTIAGVFNIASAGPTPEFSGHAGYTVGSYGEQRLDAAGGGSADDGRLGARVAVMHFTREGRLYNTLLDRMEDRMRQQAQRVRLRVAPDPGWDAEFTLAQSDTQMPFWPVQLFRLDQDTRDFLVQYDPRIEDDPYNFQTSFNIPGQIQKDSETAIARLAGDLGTVAGIEGLSTVLVAGWSHLDSGQFQDLDVSPADIARLIDIEDHLQQSLEWRLNGRIDLLPGDGVDFVAGLFAFRSVFHLLADVVAGEDLAAYGTTEDARQLASGGAAPSLPFGGGSLGGLLGPIGGAAVGDDRYAFDFLQETLAMAVFGQFDWHIGRWTITPGLRFNRERKISDAIGQGRCQAKETTGSPCVMETLLGANDYEVRGLSRTETDLSPKLSVLYRINDELSVFATHARGFKSGGVNAISFTGEDLEFEPERARSTELGLRSTWLDRSLSLNATVYRMRFSNLQVLAFNGVFFDVANAGSAESRGMELDLQWLTPYEPLTLNASVGLLDARYLVYRGAPAPVSEGIGATQDLSGRRLAFAPPVTATVSPVFEYLIGGWQLRLGIDARYQGEQYTDTDLDPNTRSPAHTIWSAQLSLGSPSGWQLMIGGKNLTDERVLNQVIDTAFFPGTYQVHQNPGRSWFATFDWRW